MTSELIQVEGEEVRVVRSTPMGLATVADIRDQTEHGLALFEERVRVAKKQLAIALKLTTGSQWMVYGEGDKRQIYATAGAADRILRVGFGMRWGAKTVTIEKDAEGVTATARADLLTHDGQVYEPFEGKRRMVYNPERKGGIEGYIKDEPNLIKSALANMAHIAVTQLLGLRFLTPADFREMGLDVDKLTRRVEFQDHGEDEGSVPVVAFGKNKGKPITDLSDQALSWYIGAAEKNIADPEKAKWKSKEEKWLASLQSEQSRRANSPQGLSVDHNYGPPPMDAREPGEDG